jgi:AcrR family transcriptional regulator
MTGVTGTAERGEGQPPAPGPSLRDQRTRRSRERILQAAIDVLVEDGYVNATTTRIQERAGVSRGRLLHHFPSREELLVAAVQHLADQRVRQTVERAMTQLDSMVDGRERLNQVIDFMWGTFHEPHYWASLELWTAARTNDQIAQALLPQQRRLDRTANRSVDIFFGAPFTGHPHYIHVRDTLLASMRGQALSYTYMRRDHRQDPHVAQWKELAALLLEP